MITRFKLSAAALLAALSLASTGALAEPTPAVAKPAAVKASKLVEIDLTQEGQSWSQQYKGLVTIGDQTTLFSSKDADGLTHATSVLVEEGADGVLSLKLNDQTTAAVYGVEAVAGTILANSFVLFGNLTAGPMFANMGGTAMTLAAQRLSLPK